MDDDVAGVHIERTFGSVLYAPSIEGTAIEKRDEAGLNVGLRCCEKRAGGSEKTSSVHNELILVAGRHLLSGALARLSRFAIN